MGLGKRVDRCREREPCEGKRISDIPRLTAELPLQFDDPRNKTIELIDALWVYGGAIAAAFEIELTTAIDLGLLRMSDLI